MIFMLLCMAVQLLHVLHVSVASNKRPRANPHEQSIEAITHKVRMG